MDRAWGQARAGTEGNPLKPLMGWRVIVLWQEAAGAPSSVFSWGKVRAKKEQILWSHMLSEAKKERERIEIGKDAKESNESGGA